MNNAKKIAAEIDMVAEGFAVVPVVENPPKVKWGKDFCAWDMQKQNTYLMKFAEAMNHAAEIIMGERDELGRLAELKEKQIQKMSAAVAANNAMLQQEVTRMNEQRQGYNKTIAELNAKIRELKNGTVN